MGFRLLNGSLFYAICLKKYIAPFWEDMRNFILFFFDKEDVQGCRRSFRRFMVSPVFEPRGQGFHFYQLGEPSGFGGMWPCWFFCLVWDGAGSWICGPG